MESSLQRQHGVLEALLAETTIGDMKEVKAHSTTTLKAENVL
jgi:hypothetical protein